MREWKRMVRGGALLGVLLSAAVGFAGCGSSSDSGGQSGGLQVTGTVSAPEAQVARAGIIDPGLLARALSIGSPAEAGSGVARRPVGNATVEAARLGDSTPLVTTTTDAEGHFVIQITGLPTGAPIVITVRGRGPNGPIRLRAAVRAAANATTEVNEATTVAAEAAEIVASEGADEETAVETAETVEQTQEAAETTDPAEVPDLQDSEEARDDVEEQAEECLVANLGDKIIPVLSGQPLRRQAMQAVMASQVYAHRTLGLPVPVRLSRAQVVTLVQQIQAGRQFSAAEVATALAAAGVKAGDNDMADTDVATALAALKARPVLTTALANVTETQTPMVVALLLAEQAGDTNVPFAITTQEQINGFVSALAGN